MSARGGATSSINRKQHIVHSGDIHRAEFDRTRTFGEILIVGQGVVQCRIVAQIVEDVVDWIEHTVWDTFEVRITRVTIDARCVLFGLFTIATSVFVSARFSFRLLSTRHISIEQDCDAQQHNH